MIKWIKKKIQKHKMSYTGDYGSNGVWATRAIMGQVGRGENCEFWIGHKLQACASGG